MAKSKQKIEEVDNNERYSLTDNDFTDQRLQNMHDHIKFLDRVLDKQNKEYIILAEKIKNVEFATIKTLSELKARIIKVEELLAGTEGKSPSKILC